jgi:ribosomal protein S18 acetylase RimI-like enzyme
VRNEIRHLGAGDEDAVLAAGSLFDHVPDRDATRRFLNEPTHHLLIAYDSAGSAVGFVSGVETTHPDKGTEMFLYELSVDPPVRRRGIGRSLVEELATLAEERGCYGMWAGTEPDNVAARRTYELAGARTTPAHLILEWSFGDAQAASRNGG